jgi:hypothetical protein
MPASDKAASATAAVTAIRAVRRLRRARVADLPSMAPSIPPGRRLGRPLTPMVLPVGSKTDRLVTNKTNPGIEPTTII